jgi:hypothetical protein
VKLQRRRPLDTVVKDAFWAAVRDCLVDVFSFPAADAQLLCQDRRSQVDLAPAQVRSNVFYHREPFDVALDLAGSQAAGRPPSSFPALSDPQISAKYEAILGHHGLKP